jgi:hypothetical protein
VRHMGGSFSMLCAMTFLVGVSCATASRSPSDNQLYVESEPAGASIYVNERLVGMTPQLVPMPQDHTIKVRCSLKDHRDATTNVYREIAPAAAWDAPIFALVDQVSGSAYRLQRKTLFVELTPMTPPDAGR